MPLSAADMRPALLLLISLIVVGCGVEGVVPPGPETIGKRIDGSDLLLVVGDWGAGTSEQEAVAEAMREVAGTRDVGAIVTTGDNFYSDDAGSLIEPFAWATEEDIPFLVAWGNHDVETGRRIEAVNEEFENPPRWVSYRWGGVEIVILDSTQVSLSEQVDFLVEALEENELPTIVVFHHPPYSCGAHGDTETIQNAWVALFDDDVFLVLSGHEHNYQRFEVSGITYVVTGGGGAALTELTSCSPDHPDRVLGESAHHFLLLEQGEGIVLSAIHADGDVIEQVELDLP